MHLKGLILVKRAHLFCRSDHLISTLSCSSDKEGGIVDGVAGI